MAGSGVTRPQSEESPYQKSHAKLPSGVRLRNSQVKLRLLKPGEHEKLRTILDGEKLDRLYPELTEEDASKMWEIASHNGSPSEAVKAMLPPDAQSPAKWRGNGWQIKEGFGKVISVVTPSCISSQEEFPLNGKWNMKISKKNQYDVDFGGHAGQISLSLTTKKDRIRLKFPAGYGKQYPQSKGKKSTSSNERITLDIRMASPKVLVGQAWEENSEKKWRLVLLKMVANN